MTTLIDLGAQVSSISSRFCELLTLEVHPLHRLLELEGTGGSTIPYMGYVEVKSTDPRLINSYNKDILLLVIWTMTYSEKVLVMVGSKIIDQVMGMMTKGELTRATTTLKQAHFGVVISGSLQLPHMDSKEDGEVGKEGTPSQALILQHPGGSSWMMYRVLSIPLRRLPFPHLGLLASMATQVSGDTVCGSTCWVNQCKAPSCLPSMVPTATHGKLHPGSSQTHQSA